MSRLGELPASHASVKRPLIVFQVIVLGEDLTRFRDASKALYRFVRAFSWNSRVERKLFLWSPPIPDTS